MYSLLLVALAAGLMTMVARRGIRCEAGCSTLSLACFVCFQTPVLFECTLEYLLNICT
jgi:hypothetical protein